MFLFLKNSPIPNLSIKQTDKNKDFNCNTHLLLTITITTRCKVWRPELQSHSSQEQHIATFQCRNLVNYNLGQNWSCFQYLTLIRRVNSRVNIIFYVLYLRHASGAAHCFFLLSNQIQVHTPTEIQNPVGASPKQHGGPEQHELLWNPFVTFQFASLYTLRSYTAYDILEWYRDISVEND